MNKFEVLDSLKPPQKVVGYETSNLYEEKTEKFPQIIVSPVFSGENYGRLAGDSIKNQTSSLGLTENRINPSTKEPLHFTKYPFPGP